MGEDSKDPNGLPPGWRPNWRTPKERGAGPLAMRALAHARAREEVPVSAFSAEPLPSADQIRDRAVAVLLGIAESESAMPSARVAAAGGLLEATSRKVDGLDAALTDEQLAARYRELVTRIFGDKAETLLRAEPVLNGQPELEPGRAESGQSAEETAQSPASEVTGTALVQPEEGKPKT